MSLTIAIDGSAAAKNVFLIKGAFDETSSLDVVTSRGLSNYTLDLAGLTAMNSHGVGSWMKFLASASKNSVSLRRVRPFMIDYANQVAGFLPKSLTIESFFVPYATADGTKEEFILFSKGVEFDDQEVRVPATVTSKTTGDILELDVRAATYFRFLGRRVMD